jgi:hypothetical protein
MGGIGHGQESCGFASIIQAQQGKSRPGLIWMKAGGTGKPMQAFLPARNESSRRRTAKYYSSTALVARSPAQL